MAWYVWVAGISLAATAIAGCLFAGGSRRKSLPVEVKDEKENDVAIRKVGGS